MIVMTKNRILICLIQLTGSVKLADSMLADNEVAIATRKVKHKERGHD